MSRRQCTLADVITLGNGKSRPHSAGKNPIYGGNGILGHTSESNYNDETIIIGRVGAYCGSVYYEKRPIWVSDNALAAKAKERNHPKYLYYFLSDLKLNQFAEGSSHPLMTQTLLNSIEVEISDNEIEQCTIATVLSSLDDKIDLLHRQNKSLEAMAETLFRQWFVEEVEINLIQLGDIIEVFDSKRIPLSSMQRANMKEGPLYPYYGAATIMDYVNQYIFDGEYLLLGEDGTVQTDEGFPVLQLATGQFWVNNHTHVLRAKKPFTNFLLYTILRKTSISHIVTGAVQPKINQENLKSLELEIANENQIAVTAESTEVLWHKIQHNKFQICTLEKLRDTLLPKLMSGEVKVAL